MTPGMLLAYLQTYFGVTISDWTQVLEIPTGMYQALFLDLGFQHCRTIWLPLPIGPGGFFTPYRTEGFLQASSVPRMEAQAVFLYLWVHTKSRTLPVLRGPSNKWLS